MVEPEGAFMSLEGGMELAEGLICYLVEQVLSKHRSEIQSMLERNTAPLDNVKKPFPRITYSEAVERLRAAGHPVQWGDDFGGDEETVLANQFDRPVIVHRYPASLKDCYFTHYSSDPKLALSVGTLEP